MLKNISYRLFILPTFLLAAFIGFFAYIESRKLSNNERIRDVINDPVASMAFKLEYASWKLESVFESYKTAIAENRQKPLTDFLRALEDFGKYQTLMTTFLLLDQMKAEDYLHELDSLTTIQDDIGHIKGVIGKATLFDEKIWGLVKKRIEETLEASHHVGIDINRKHQEELNALLEEIAADEHQRALLAFFILLCGFAFIVVLLDAVYHFKNNAERAQAAEKYNALFAAALQNTRVGVLIRDMQKEGQPVVFVNEAFSRLTGYSLNDVQSSSSDFLFGWDTNSMDVAAFRRAVSLRETGTFEFLLYRKDGSPFWSEWYLSPLLGEGGRLDYYVSLFSDITAFRQTQEDLIQAKSLAEQASAIKSSFLAMMSHEIRTPINGILGVLKLMQETVLDEDQKHLLGIAKTSSAALHSIINDILDYAKMEAGRIEVYSEPFSLKDTVKELVDFAGSLVGEKKVVLVSEVQEGLPELFVSDPSRLRQILLNLLSNAIKFTDEGSVKVRVLSMMEQEIEGHRGHLMRFEVQDTGIGISPDDQGRLFQEFSQLEHSFTRRFGGTGLGLAICRRLVALLGGEIGVESQVGKGSKFWFMLPLREADQEDLVCKLPTSATTEEVSQITKNHRILLVEDNETNRLVAARYLEKAGLAVDEACNGLEAIKKARETDYSLILMDVSMPEMDGMLATCHIRSLGGHNTRVPIVALTAHVMAGDRELCLAAGMNDYLNKPLEYNSLLRVLERWMHIRVADSPNLLTGRNKKETLLQNEKTPPVFDEQILQRMKDDLGGKAVEQVTRVFLEDSARRMETFKGAGQEVIRDTAHTLKSCSANCGLIQFSHLMRELEQAAAQNNNERVASLLSLVEGSYAEARAKLEQERVRYITDE